MLGVCYYPEHWPSDYWPQDAKKMRALGLEYVRIGEFAWSRLEPGPGELHFEWLDEAIEILAGAGLKVIIGTPTATPPKWLIDQFPEVLPVDPDTGRVRGFGSRRHYDFSSDRYLAEALRITEQLASRYGRHPGVVGWQTDNELCCHNTTLSASPAARDGFQAWCRERYKSIERLNKAWGNVFWSMEYRDFAEIELPVGAVTETSPSHRLAYHRFSSDKVIHFHNRMVEVLRRHSPEKFITHNFIPMNETGVDNFALAKLLDFPSYDNYPLGRTDLQFAGAPPEQMRRYMRTGHPDYATYYFDQTRGLDQAGGLGGGRFWVMEQQPGPVNWANHNPRPAPGMVRLWTLEAFAHGAACVCYFRWRQAPFAQEQMHAGLLRADNSKSAAWAEIEQVNKDLSALELSATGTDPADSRMADVAIITETQAQWVSEIECQGRGYHFNDVMFSYYSALRRNGVDVDFIAVDDDFSRYKMILAPCLPVIDQGFIDNCRRSGAIFLFGPRTGSKTAEFNLPADLPPGPLRALAPLKVLSTETLRPDCSDTFCWNGTDYPASIWNEEIEAPGAEVLAVYKNGAPCIVRYQNLIYQATLTDDNFLQPFLAALCRQARVAVTGMPETIRIRRRGNLMFTFNYADCEQATPSPAGVGFVIGGKTLAPYDVAVWKIH